MVLEASRDRLVPLGHAGRLSQTRSAPFEGDRTLRAILIIESKAVVAQSIREAYQHCQRCGQSVAAPRDGGPTHCDQCGYTHHFNPITAVGVILYASDQVLLIRRGREPGKGRLALPGGFVDLGERAEEAAAREIHEELGLRITSLDFVATFPNSYEYQGIDIPIVDIFFASAIDVSSSHIRIEESEVSEAIWMPIGSDVLGQMAFPSNALALREWSGRQREQH